jgi:hypothetical protein
MKKFLSYLIGTIWSPRRTFTLISEENSIFFGLGALLLYSGLYIVTELIMISNNLQPAVPPYLPIPVESYYFWQVFFTIPVVVLSWLILGISMYLLVVKVFKGQGSLKQYLNILSFSFSMPSIITMWTMETYVAAFHPEWWGHPEAAGIPYWITQTYLWVGSIWSIILGVICVMLIGKLSWSKSTFVSLIALALAIGTLMIFIR